MMRKLVLAFAVAVLVAWSGVAYAADVGHGGDQPAPVEDPVEVEAEAPAEEVKVSIEEQQGVTLAEVEISQNVTEISSTEKEFIASQFTAPSVTSVAVAAFPDIKLTVTEVGASATIAFKVETTKLLEAFHEAPTTELNVAEVVFILWHANGTTFTKFTYAPRQSGRSIKTMENSHTFMFVDKEGNPVDKLSNATTEVYPLFDVTDNSDEDLLLDSAGAIEIRPSAVVTHSDSEEGGSSGGCDAGFSGAALLLAGGWFLLKKRGA